ncbi:adenylosuccinate lyase [Candidatus Bathyarchaeota archaeon]|nr:adenylosuccinate lyase [Candidatus Bathyarchaeota archaeon]
MPVHAIETRYRTNEMYALFTEEYKLQKWLDVEIALIKAHVKLGNIPPDAVDEVARKGKTSIVTLQRVKEIEREIHHDIMAMVKGFAEQCEGDTGKYIHLGATSYDIVDTAWALIFKDALSLLEKRLKTLLEILTSHATSKRELVCVGRTHGQHAIPTTYGMKFANWADEFARHLARLQDIKVRDVVGKFGGAVGTMASHVSSGIQLQRYIMDELGLIPNLISTQIVHRDRHAEIMFWTALVASTISKIAKEIRDLQRNELAEMFEPFAKKQVGSSTMASKRNPHKSERLCGLYRLLAAHVMPAMENNALIEHERDLTNSSVERIMFPENFILLDFMLVQFTSILQGIEINKAGIRKNLELTKGAIMSEYVMVELVGKGMSRQEAHEVLRQVAIRCRQEGISFKQGIQEDNRVGTYFKSNEIDDLFDPSRYIGAAPELVDRTVASIRDKWLKDE